MGIIFILWNAYCCYLMYSDKRRSIKQEWRISEKQLLLSALCFGGAGIWLGMAWFRHKTKHWYFKLFVPICAIIQVMLLGYLAVQGC